MARIVVKTEKIPQEVKLGDKSVWICKCGLSATQPFCNGNHMKTLDEPEGKMFRYENGKRIEVEVKDKA